MSSVPKSANNYLPYHHRIVVAGMQPERHKWELGNCKKEVFAGTELRKQGQVTTSAGINSHRRVDQSELNGRGHKKNTGHVRGQPRYLDLYWRSVSFAQPGYLCTYPHSSGDGKPHPSGEVDQRQRRRDEARKAKLAICSRTAICL